MARRCQLHEETVAMLEGGARRDPGKCVVGGTRSNFPIKAGTNFVYNSYTIRWNLPFHVFMNGNQVRFTPYIARACHRVFSSILDVLYQIIELQCYRLSPATKLVYDLMKQRYGRNNDAYDEKIAFLCKLARSEKRVYW